MDIIFRKHAPPALGVNAEIPAFVNKKTGGVISFGIEWDNNFNLLEYEPKPWQYSGSFSENKHEATQIELHAIINAIFMCKKIEEW
jgi:hypothetical protein